jgi:DNA invertase Pin-like site-specific DNA recombinase
MEREGLRTLRIKVEDGDALLVKKLYRLGRAAGPYTPIIIMVVLRWI